MRHHGVPEAVHRRHRGVLGVPAPRSRTPTTRMSCCRTARHPRRRPRPARRRAARAQHHGRAARRRARADRVRRRPPARQDLLQHRDLPGAGADRHAPPRARRVPGEPAADGRDAARPPADRARRRHHRSRRRSSRSGWPTTIAAASGSSSALGGGRATAYEIAADLWPEKTVLDSPCSSSGRCSGTSICCSTPDASASR